MSGLDDLGSGHRKIKMGSDRSFGLVFAGVFALIGTMPVLLGGGVRPLALVVSAAMLITALVAPTLLKSLNTAWFKLGLALSRVMTPIVMGILFFGAFVPLALVMRLRGKDLLNTRRDQVLKSYWVERAPPAPRPGSMVKQF